VGDVVEHTGVDHLGRVGFGGELESVGEVQGQTVRCDPRDRAQHPVSWLATLVGRRAARVTAAASATVVVP